MSTQDYKGRALITGGSAGIGAVYADRLARRGYDLVLVARNRDRLEALASQITRATGRKVEVVTADLGAKADVQRIEERLRTDRSITALINNAGVGATAPLLDSDVDQLDAMIQLNVVTVTRLAHAAGKAFAARGQGLIVNIASIVALAPEMLNGVYSASKAYVLSLTLSLHNEVNAKGVQVQAVLPGATATEFWDRAGLAVKHLPNEIVMATDEMVDAALAGLDQHELVTIPSLPDLRDWESYAAARAALKPNLSRNRAADRYRKNGNASARG